MALTVPFSGQTKGIWINTYKSVTFHTDEGVRIVKGDTAKAVSIRAPSQTKTVVFQISVLGTVPPIPSSEPEKDEIVIFRDVNFHDPVLYADTRTLFYAVEGKYVYQMKEVQREQTGFTVGAPLIIPGSRIVYGSQHFEKGQH